MPGLLFEHSHASNGKVTTLFATADEIQELLYSREEERTDQSVLRLYNWSSYMLGSATICFPTMAVSSTAVTSIP